jgi:Transposase DNA-binding/Transposase DDE domain
MVSGDLALAHLGDARLTRRFQQMSATMAKDPRQSFPKAMVTEATQEAAYRFFKNKGVTFAMLVASHVESTARRAAVAGTVLVLHDTTKFKFTGESPRAGLGRLTGTKAEGFFSHVSLCVEEGATGLALGVIACENYTRHGAKKWVNNKRVATDAKESERWLRGVGTSQIALGEIRPIHVMDREGDAYELIATMVAQGDRMVVRMAHDRVLVTDEHVQAVLARAPVAITREIYVQRRPESPEPRSKLTHPARPARTAVLTLRAATVVLRRPAALGNLAASTPVNLVQVIELDPPAGQTAIEWTLLTTETVATVAEVERIVDIYRQRWLIEEYFKALKTGCEFESRQLETYDGLCRALALFLPIAWMLLVLRDAPRVTPDAPGTLVLSSTQIDVLRATGHRLVPENPTVAQVMFAVAGLGGHITNNGAPGWRVLGRGLYELLQREKGWRAACAQQTSNVS